ncbi:type II toxin-antitoxin system RelE/ParE family toxin [Bifidobacterium margollesii]|uniref:type II toxin-antitoxin system RelE/ParE family toxin n=1 Tax=Bifidobacterium margollesii TaxID=2020964 RepID=UPI000C75F12E|nr:type II toxin-antitoxin system RelE/ParE family toxin [Bifidobacterium margollesii]
MGRGPVGAPCAPCGGVDPRFVEGWVIDHALEFDGIDVHAVRIAVKDSPDRGETLEPPRGDLQGRWSIRVNQQWRLVFRWNETDNKEAADVYFDDYHG